MFGNQFINKLEKLLVYFDNSKASSRLKGTFFRPKTAL